MISDKHKFIFIHIPKCGGNSIGSSHYTGFGHNLRQKNFKYFKDTERKHTAQFTFTFVRNPWDRLVSSYFYLKNGGNCKEDKTDFENFFIHYSSFEDMLLNWNDIFYNQIHFKPQWEWICDDDENIIVDYVGRVENFQEDFNIVCDKIGIPRQQLPHKNKSKHKYYTEYYDDETKQIVAEKYAKDIEYFGYEFGE